MKHRTTNRHLRLEPLETRRLLAADLLVDHGPLRSTSTNEAVRLIRVHNIGDEVASNTLIRSSLTEEFVAPTWQRRFSNASFSAAPSGGREPDFELEGDDFSSISELLPIGDFNGDGAEDLVAANRVLLSGIGSSMAEHRSVEISGARFISPLGDINGDGFDDITSNGHVIWGRPEVGKIDLDGMNTGEWTEFQIEDRTDGHMRRVGDINGDGFDDFTRLGDHRLFLGRSGYSSSSIVDLDQVDTGHQIALCKSPEESCPARNQGLRIYGSSPVGDVNGDGFDDAIFGMARVGVIVLFGGEQTSESPLYANALGNRGFLIPVDDDVLLGFDVSSPFGWEYVSFTQGDDLNDDGYSDVVISMLGQICDCTSSGQGGSEANGGAAVIFGGPNVGAGGQFDESVEDVLRLELTVNHSDERPSAVVRDVDADGTGDIVLSSEFVTYVVRNTSEITDIDFGYGGQRWTISNTSLNGDDGHGVLGNRSFVDLNRDGFVDEIIFDDGEPGQVFLGSPSISQTIQGSGDIHELVDIGPGRSVVYEVRGNPVDNGRSPSTTAVADGKYRVEELQDNFVSELDGILVDVHTPATFDAVRGQSFEWQFRVENVGPSNATNVHVDMKWPDDIAEVTWQRDSLAFPSVVDLSRLNGADGAVFEGPERFYVETRFAPDYEMPVFSGFGIQVGSLGDPDNNGFDDFYGVGFPLNERGRFSEDLAAIEFVGGPRADGTLALMSETLSPPAEAIEPIGDFNGDGFIDRFFGDPTASDFRGETYVVFGMERGIPIVDRDDLNGKNGFTVTGAKPDDRTGHTLAIGDIDNDGFDDLIIGRGRDDWREAGPRGQRDSAVHVIYGHANTSASYSLDSIAPEQGFRLKTRGESNSVASDLDVDGDGIDDIVVGDSYGGVITDTGWCSPHGAVYVVYGRQRHSETGTGPITDSVNIPLGSEVIYTVRGAMPGDAAVTPVVVSAIANQQLQLDPRTNQAAVDVAIRTVGDANDDSLVNFEDFLVMQQNFGRDNAAIDDGDFNGDGIVDFSDYLVLSASIQP